MHGLALPLLGHCDQISASSRYQGTTASISFESRSRRVWRFLPPHAAWTKQVCYAAASSPLVGEGVIVACPDKSAFGWRLQACGFAGAPRTRGRAARICALMQARAEASAGSSPFGCAIILVRLLLTSLIAGHC
jgi:hypothetical protein